MIVDRENCEEIANVGEAKHTDHVRLFGIPIRPVTMSEAVQEIDTAIVTRRNVQIGVVNAAKIVNMHRDPGLRESVMNSDVIYADGMAVVWASRLLGKALPERVAGIDLMHSLMRLAHRKRYRVFCLGAKQPIVEEVVRVFQREYPEAEVVGARNGYFTENEEQSVAEEVREAGADILFVAITSPKKERFMARWGEHMGVPIVHGVGGSFDVVAGLVKRAPTSWQKNGFEWLYRVLQEPRRLIRRYLVTNSMFLWLVLREKFQPRRLPSR